MVGGGRWEKVKMKGGVGGGRGGLGGGGRSGKGVLWGVW